MTGFDETLREGIIALKLVPGQNLSRTAIADLFHASQTPARDAFRARTKRQRPGNGGSASQARPDDSAALCSIWVALLAG